MRVIAVNIVFRLYEVFSLKEKRSIRRKVIERLKNKFNISIAGTGSMDSLTTLEIGFSAVSNDYKHLDEIYQNVINFIESNFMLELVDVEKEFLCEKDIF